MGALAENLDDQIKVLAKLILISILKSFNSIEIRL